MRAITCVMISALAFTSAAAAMSGPESVTKLHRLYDMTPVSPTNPLVADVPESGIEIPLSELHAYVKTLSPQQLEAVGSKNERILTAVQTRKCLDRLLDEHFLLEDGYRHKVDQSPKLEKMLADTQKMLLEETLVQEEVGDKAKSGAEYRTLSQQLLDKIFDRAAVTISTEAWAELKAAAKRAGEGKQTDPSAMTLLSEKARNTVLMRVEGISVATGDVLDAYLFIPPDKRPDIMTQTGLVALLKALVGEQMLVIEARARGMERSPHVVNLLQLNRNILVRMAVIDHLTGEAIKQMKAPDIESRLHAWFDANKARFTSKDTTGVERVANFEKLHDAIANRYFDELSARVREDFVKTLRTGHRIDYNDAVLAHVAIERPRPVPTTLPSSIVTWAADRQENTVKEGEPMAVFVFRFTNVSADPVTIYRIEPACECTNVSAAPLPWTIAPGKGGEMTVAVDVHGKSGTYLRTVEIDSSEGPKTLTMEIHAPEKGKQAQSPTSSPAPRA